MTHPLSPVALAVLSTIAPAQELRERHDMLPGVDAASAVELGDLDGDGAPDAFLLPGRLLINDGEGRFVEASQGLPAGFVGVMRSDVDLADVDQDGDLDALATGPYFPDQLLLNDGTGSFSDATANMPFGSSNEVAVGDVNGDGLPDIVLARGGFFGTPNALHLGTGAGVFVNGSAGFPPEAGLTTRVELVDLEGDGDLDVAFTDLAAPSFTGVVRLFLNDGAGSFSDASAQFPPDGLPVGGVVFGDLDGDGDPDAFVTANPDRTYFNDGLGTFAPGANLTTSSNSANLVDLDGDGALDVLTTGVGQVLLNDGAGNLTPFGSNQFPLGLISFSLAAGVADVDGDGDVDAVVGYTGNAFSKARLHLNDGSGLLLDATNRSVPVHGDTVSSMSLGDLDGDGDLDVALGGGFVSGELRMSRNLGTGVFAGLEDLGVAGASEAFLADLDDDGDLDVYAGTPSGDSLLLNDGCGAFTDASALLPAGVPPTTALAAGDLNGDGLTDAFLGSGGADGLLLADGSGGFVYDASALPTYSVTVPTESIVLGDLDGDGDLDALTGTYLNPWRVRLCINQGGQFIDGTAALPFQPFGATGDLALGDVDGDGDLDVVIGTSSVTPAADNGLWINQGGLVFVDESHRLPPVQDLTSVVELIDLDGDGDLDLFTGNPGLPSLGLPERDRVYRNDGTGTFVEIVGALPSLPALPVSPAGSRAACFGDVDGDSDLDLVVLNDQGLGVLYEDRHQLSWQGLPRVGQPPTLRIAGQAGEHWMLWAVHYPSPTRCGFSPFGERMVVAQGVLPAAGETLVTVTAFDARRTLWRALFTGRGQRVVSNAELVSQTVH